MLTGRDQADKQSRNCASILSPVQTITHSFYRASGIVVRSKGSSNVELAFCAHHCYQLSTVGHSVCWSSLLVIYSESLYMLFIFTSNLQGGLLYSSHLCWLSKVEHSVHPLRDDQNKPQNQIRVHINFYGPGTHSPEGGHCVGIGKMEGQRWRQCCQPSNYIMQNHWPAVL